VLWLVSVSLVCGRMGGCLGGGEVLWFVPLLSCRLGCGVFLGVYWVVSVVVWGVFVVVLFLFLFLVLVSLMFFFFFLFFFFFFFFFLFFFFFFFFFFRSIFPSTTGPAPSWCHCQFFVPPPSLQLPTPKASAPPLFRCPRITPAYLLFFPSSQDLFPPNPP